MNRPTCNKCEKRASWRQSSPIGGGNVVIVRACDEHATGKGWLRAYPHPASSHKTTKANP